MAELDAVETALRALRFRDRSAAEIRERLTEHGVGEEEQQQALEQLERSGYLDDGRSHGRARSSSPAEAPATR